LKFDDDILFGLFKQGTEALSVLALCDEDPSLAEPLGPTIPNIKAQVRFAAESEMARTVDDFLVRRTEIYYIAPDQGLGVAPEVARIMGDSSAGMRTKESARSKRIREPSSSRGDTPLEVAAAPVG